MRKIKPIEQMVNDLEPGDIIRIILKKGRQYIGYFGYMEDSVAFFYNFYPPCKFIESRSFNILSPSLVVNISRKKLGCSYTRVEGYEILKRAKNKSIGEKIKCLKI